MSLATKWKPPLSCTYRNSNATLKILSPNCGQVPRSLNLLFSKVNPFKDGAKRILKSIQTVEPIKFPNRFHERSSKSILTCTPSANYKTAMYVQFVIYFKIGWNSLVVEPWNKNHENSSSWIWRVIEILKSITNPSDVFTILKFRIYNLF